jgi:hypothetical protein
LATKKGYENKNSLKIPSHFWLQKRRDMKVKKSLRFLHILGYMLEPNLEIWQHILFYFSNVKKIVNKKTQKKKKKKTLFFSHFESKKEKTQLIKFSQKKEGCKLKFKAS